MDIIHKVAYSYRHPKWHYFSNYVSGVLCSKLYVKIKIMNYTKIKLVFFALFFALFSCKLEKSEVIKVTPSGIAHLSFEKIQLKECLHPQRMAVVDSMLVIQDMTTTTSPLFHVYSLKDYSYCYSFGKKGQGPQEFIMPILQKNGSDTSSLLIYDFSNRKIAKYKLTHKEASLINELKLSNISYEDTEKFVFVGDDKYAGVPFNGKGSLFLYDLKRDIISYTQFYPRNREKISEKCIPYYYDSQITTDGNTIISAMLLFPQINFFTKDGKYIKSITFSKDYNSFLSVDACKKGKTYTTNTVFCYLDICSHFNTNYALYFQNNESYYDELSLNNLGTCEIHIFNNTLDDIKKINLPVLVKNIVINSCDESIIGLSLFEEPPCLYIFK